MAARKSSPYSDPRTTAAVEDNGVSGGSGPIWRLRDFVTPTQSDVDSATTALLMEHVGAIFLHFLIYGVAAAVLGVLAVAIPVVFLHISVQRMVASMMVIAGLAALLHFMLLFRAPGRTSLFLIGVLHLAVGLWLLLHARVRKGASFLWLILAWFILHGFVKLFLGFELRGIATWPSFSVAGSASIILGILLVALAPTYGLAVVGVAFGVDLLMTAISFLLIAARARIMQSNAHAARSPLLQD